MRKKGFTLTEMIGAIVVLAIVIALAVVAFTGIRNNILQRDYENLVSYLETKAANYSENTGELNVSVERLIEAGYIDADEANKLINPKDKSSMNCMMLESVYENGSYKATMGDDIGEASSGKCNTYEISKEIQICIDPENGCNGELKEWFNENVTLGVKIGGSQELTENANIVWKVDGISYTQKTITTNILSINKGVYTVEVRYDDTREDGTTKHFEGTDTIAINIDRDKPVIVSSKVAKADEWSNVDKELSMVLSDGNGSGIKYVYVGNKTCDTVATDEWKQHEITQYTTTLGAGQYHLCVQDAAGNISNDISEVRIAKIDRDIPTCKIIVPEVDGENGWYISKVTLTLEYEDGSDGSGVLGYDLTTSETPSYKGKTTDTQIDTTETTYYGHVRDKAGNVGLCTKTVKVDTQDPICTVTAPNPDGDNNWYKGNVTLSLNEIHKTSAIVGRDITTSATASYTGSTSKTQSDDTTGTMYYGYVKAESGRTGTCSKSVKVDTQDPVCNITAPNPDGNNNWYKGNVTLTLNTTKKTSNIVGYDISTSTTASYNKNTSKTQSTDTAGTTYYGYVKAESGRVGSCNKTVKVDKQDPACSITAPTPDGENSWYRGNVTLTLNETPRTSSIVGRDITTSSSASYGGSRSKTQSADTNSVTYYGYVKADSGRTGTCSKVIKKDNTKPTCSVGASGTTSNGYYTSQVTLTLSTNDGGGSPISTYGLAASSSANYNKVSSTTYNQTGNVTYYGYVKDQAGNTNSCSKAISTDLTPPNVTSMSIGRRSGYNYNSRNVTVTMGGSDQGSGVVAYCYTTTNNSNTCSWSSSTSSSFSANAVYGTDGSGQTITLYGFVKDKVGRISSARSATYTLYTACTTKTASKSDTRGGCSSSCGSGTRTVTHYWQDSYLGTACPNTTNTESCSDSSGCCYDCYCYYCPPEPDPTPTCDAQCMADYNSAAWSSCTSSCSYYDAGGTYHSSGGTQDGLHNANVGLYGSMGINESTNYNSATGQWTDNNGNCTNCRP